MWLAILVEFPSTLGLIELRDLNELIDQAIAEGATLEEAEEELEFTYEVLKAAEITDSEALDKATEVPVTSDVDNEEFMADTTSEERLKLVKEGAENFLKEFERIFPDKALQLTDKIQKLDTFLKQLESFISEGAEESLSEKEILAMLQDPKGTA